MVSEPLQTLAAPAKRRDLVRALSIVCVVASAFWMPRFGWSQSSSLQTNTLTLGVLLDSVRSNFPAIQATASRVRAAQGARTTAGAFGNPVLMYETDQTPFPGGRPLVGMSRQTMITAMVPLESFYQRGPRITQSAAELRAAQADAIVMRQRVALDAAAAYYRVAMAQIEVETTQDLVGWLDSVVAYNQPRVREGVTSEADLIRSTIERDRVKSEGAMKSAELLRARAALAVFFSSSTRALSVAIDDIPFGHPELSGSPIGDVGLQASAETRGEVRAASERVTALSAAISVERSMTLRQLGATIGMMQSMGMTSMIAGLSLPLPLFDRNRGEVQRVTAEREVAEYDLAVQRRTANADVRGAYDAAQLLTDRATALTQRDTTNLLRRAEESRRIALGAYQEGAVPLFQVIDAARAWADTRVTYFRTVFEQQQSVLMLLFAQGQDLFTSLSVVSPTRGSN